MNNKIIIFGYGTVSKCCISYFKSYNNHQISCITVDSEKLTTDNYFSIPIITYDKLKENFDKNDVEIIICVGYSNNNFDRQKVYNRIKNDGWQVGSLIPDCLEPKIFKYSEGTIIFPGSLIQPFARIGTCSIIWPGSVIGHHSSIGDFCWLASNSAVGGFSKIGENTFIGLNSTISDNLNIGRNNIIGAGTFISKNTEKDSVYFRNQDQKFKLSVPNFLKLTKFGNNR